jgi:predicted HTH domain antitoxin
MATSWRELSELTHLSEAELRQALALALYEERKLSLGRAARLADLSQWDFLSLLAQKGVTIDYSLDDLKDDIKTIAELESQP